MMTTIPTTYFSKNLYTEMWGDPRNQHAVYVPVIPHHTPRGGDAVFSLVTLASSLRQRFVHPPAMPDCIEPSGA